MPQFTPPPVAPKKSPAQAFLEPVGQTIQALPLLWREYKLKRMELDQKERELKGKFGSGLQPGQDPATMTREQQLAAMGTEGYSRLNPPSYIAIGPGTEPGPLPPGMRPVSVPNPPMPPK